MGANSIKIKNYKVISKNPSNSLSKIQKIICKLFKITPLTKYRYHIQIAYFGRQRLRPQDVLTDGSGNIYTVLEEQNRLARLMSYTPMSDKPPIHGILYLQGRASDKGSQTKKEEK